MGGHLAFRARYRELLARLDEILSSLRQDVESCHRVQPPSPDFAARAQEAAALVGDLRAHISEGCRATGLTEPAWPDREALEALTVAILQAMRDKEQVEARRQLLADLAAMLHERPVPHHVPRRRDQLERLRQEAQEELERAAQSGTPPPVPGPQVASAWSQWVCMLPGEALQQRLDEMAPTYPALARLLEEVDPKQLFASFASEDRPASPEGDAPLRRDGRPPTLGNDEPPAAPQVLSEGPPVQPSVLQAPADAAPAAAEPAATEEPAPLEEAAALEAAVQDAATTASEASGSESGQTDAEVEADQPAQEVPVAAPSARSQPPTSEPPPPLSPARLAEELADFDRFRGSYWIDPNGRCAPVPWQEPAFIEHLRAVSSDDIRRRVPLGRVWLLARAIEEIKKRNPGLDGDSDPDLDPEDLRAAAHLLAAPTSASAGADARRAENIAQALQGDWAPIVARASAWRLRLVLEALRPNTSQIFPPATLDPLLRELHFKTPALHNFVRELLLPALRSDRGLQRVMDRLRRASPRSPEECERALHEQRKKLRETYRQLYCAAGGRIERTFARDAWDRYIARIDGIVRDLFPPVPGRAGGQATWDPSEMDKKLVALLDECQRCIEEAEVRFQDRQRMLHGAHRLYDEAVRVNQLMAEWQASGRASSTDLDRACGRACQAAQGLIDGSLPERPEEQLGRWLVEGVLRGGPAPGFRLEGEGERVFLPNLDPQVLKERPRLRALWRSITEDGCDGDRVLIAAALAALPAGEVPLSQPDQIVLAIQQRRAELDRLRQESSELAAGELAEQIRKVEERAEQEVKVGDDVTRTALVEAWLAEVVHKAREQVDAIEKALRARAASHPAQADIDKALSGRRFADALWLLSWERRGGDRRRRRETLFRAQAQELYQHPREVLEKELQKERERQPATRRKRDFLLMDLLDTWLSVPTTGTHNQFLKLRRCFSEYFLSARHKGQVLHALGGPHTPGQPLRLPAAALIEWLVHERSPSFVPQMRDFGSLVIATPELARSDHLGDLASGEGNPLVVVLYPGLPGARRDQLLERIVQERRCVAVLDDLDLCRLLHPQGMRPDGVLGLLELALEQQRLRPLTPFKSHGQPFLPDLFVGRQEEARDLAETDRYTRLFSGRKLGKTALLRYLAERHDGRKLPSGFILRIVYCDMTGRETEQQVVHEIREALSERIGDLRLPPAASSAVDAFEAMMDAFLKQCPGQSLLLILDEADGFVARQLRELAERHEQTLSWCMRKLMQSGPADSHQLPRVRLLFSGYRVTNTWRGAWANWGDVLALKPLHPQDAADLIAGPLARLGIDASEQAFAIAHRCGCQPAVLMRFGEVLLDRLASLDTPATQRPPVRSLDVTAAFEDRRVQETIQRVVWNNFQSNDRAAVVFGALLQLFSEQPPGSGLEDAVEGLREELGRLGVKLPDAADEARSFLRAQLRVLAERELLVQEGDRYFLRFPHHLDTLRPDLEQELKQRVEALRRGPAQEDPEAETTAFLSPQRLRDLREAMDPKAEIRPRALLFVSHWGEALSDTRHGVGAQLDLPPDCGVRARELDRYLLRTVLSRPQLVLTDVPAEGPAGASEIVQGRPPNLPPPLLTGGADLLRWALEADRQSPWFFEITSIGRVDEAAVERWFRNARGLEFPPGGAEKIRQATSNIPLLLRALHLLLQDLYGEERTTLTAEQLDQALQALEQRLPEEARLLAEGPPEMRLSPREIEILRMVCLVGKEEKKPEDLRYALADGWSVFSEGHPGHAFTPIDQTQWEDRLALAVVGRLGLVPTGGPTHDPWLSLRAVGQEDALHRLVAHIPQP